MFLQIEPLIQHKNYCTPVNVVGQYGFPTKSTQILNLSFNQWENKHVYIVIKQHASTQEGQYTYNRKGKMEDIKMN